MQFAEADPSDSLSLVVGTCQSCLNSLIVIESYPIDQRPTKCNLRLAFSSSRRSLRSTIVLFRNLGVQYFSAVTRHTLELIRDSMETSHTN